MTRSEVLSADAVSAHPKTTKPPLSLEVLAGMPEARVHIPTHFKVSKMSSNRSSSMNDPFCRSSSI
jgi:hypothetical protein